MIDGRFDQSEAGQRGTRAATAAGGPAASRGTGGVRARHVHARRGHRVPGRARRGLALLEEATVRARGGTPRRPDAGPCEPHDFCSTWTHVASRRSRSSMTASATLGRRPGRTYGAFLRGNAADCLYQLGRWTDAEAECRAAMEWPPSGVAWFSPTLYLGLVLVESRADEEAARLIGQTLLQLETVPAGQWTALVLRAAVSLALWRRRRCRRDGSRRAANGSGCWRPTTRSRSRSPHRPAWRQPRPRPRRLASAATTRRSRRRPARSPGAARGGATRRRRARCREPSGRDARRSCIWPRRGAQAQRCGAAPTHQSGGAWPVPGPPCRCRSRGQGALVGGLAALQAGSRAVAQ